MSGINVFAANGTLEFSTENRLTRFLDTFTITGAAGSRPVAGLNTGEPHAVVVPKDNQQTSFLPPQGPEMVFDKVNQVVSWGASSYPYSYQWAVTIYVF